jgi:hypothetical protein
MAFHILKKYVVAKGCKFSLYALKFIGVSKCNRVPGNRSILQFISDQRKYGINTPYMAEKENASVRINRNNFIAR